MRTDKGRVMLRLLARTLSGGTDEVQQQPVQPLPLRLWQRRSSADPAAERRPHARRTNNNRAYRSACY